LDELDSLIDNFGNSIQVNVSLPEHAVSAIVDIRTEGLRSALAIARGFVATLTAESIDEIMK
jgi:hypothetical protein